MLRLLTVPVALATLLPQASAQNLQDCYGYDGAVQSDNVVCEGSGACCNAQATCTEQRLCHNEGDPENVFVRGPCSSRNWDGSICPQLCLYDEGDNMFPRVTQCPDGSWCCHQVFNVNSTTCCDQGQGTFLNDDGEVIDRPASSSSSVAVSTTSSTSSTSATSRASSTASDAPAQTTDTDTDDSGLSTGAKVGIGVGVGGGVLVIAGALAIAWFMMKRSRKAHQQNTEKDASSMDQLQPGSYNDDVRAHYADHSPHGQYGQHEYFKPPVGSPPVEAPASVPGHMYSGQGAVEADSGQQVGELPADVPGKPGEKK